MLCNDRALVYSGRTFFRKIFTFVISEIGLLRVRNKSSNSAKKVTTRSPGFCFRDFINSKRSSLKSCDSKSLIRSLVSSPQLENLLAAFADLYHFSAVPEKSSHADVNRSSFEALRDEARSSICLTNSEADRDPRSPEN